MPRQGRGFGLVVLVVVLVVVLLLVAQAWKRLGPTAVEVSKTSGTEAGRHPEAAAALEDLPDLEETRQRTDEHRARVTEALENAD